MKVCSIDGCEKKHFGRGWCSMHHQRWIRHGDPMGGHHRYSTLSEAFTAQTERRGDCLIWTGTSTPKGYGQVSAKGETRYAHRYAWERSMGEIPDGIQVDHTCWNPACCELSHLRLATNKQNNENRRSATSRSGLRGVYPTRNGSWVAQVKHNGKALHLGTFIDPNDAAEAAKAGRARLHTHSQN